MEISVIIPTCNRKDMLKNCLNSLFSQTYPKSKYELIVADDGSNDGTEQSVKRLIKTNHNLRYFKQQNKGPAAARNLGIKYAKGKIIAFTDDDCIVDKEWLKLIAFYHKKYPKISGIGGKTECATRNLVSLFGQYRTNKLINTQYKSNFIFIATCNASYKKKIFQEIGNFDEDFKSAAGEDTELNWRLFKKGYKLIYTPQIIVKHFQRGCFKSFIKQRFNYIRKGVFKLIKKHPDFPAPFRDKIAFLFFKTLNNNQK